MNRAADAIRVMFRHHFWATLALIDHCSKLSQEQLHEAAPGTYGPISQTLAHLVNADRLYLGLIEGRTSQPPKEEFPSLAKLRLAFAENIERWHKLLEKVEELDVTIPAYRQSWPTTPHADHLLLL